MGGLGGKGGGTNGFVLLANRPVKYVFYTERRKYYLSSFLTYRNKERSFLRQFKTLHPPPLSPF
jgi:hypothetical protein